MTQISSFLKLEVAKYKDIDQILNKLEGDGEVENIYSIFKEIFENERDFTVQELNRIEEEQKEKIDIREQCENNLSMFKCSFSLIVQMILERAYKSVNAKEIRHKNSHFTDTTRAESTIDQQSDITFPTEENVPKKKAKKRSSNASRGTSPIGNKSFNSNSRTMTPKKLKAKRPSQTTAASSTQSPLTRILSPTSTTMSIFSREKFNLSRPQSPHSTQSRSNLNQSQLNKSYSLVQSEFNHTTGAAKFSKSPKNVEVRQLSPGPGSYNLEKSYIRRSRSPTIGRAPKECYFDEMAKRNDSPGPAAYSPEKSSLRRSPSPTIGRAPKECYFDEMAKRNESPGPCAYSPEKSSLRRSPSPTIGKAPKECYFDEMARRCESPGPCAYSPQKVSLPRSISPTIDRAAKIGWLDEVVQRNESPGPGGLYPSYHFVSK